MSHTYKYPRESLSNSINRGEFGADKRIQKRLKKQRISRKKKIKIARSLKKFVGFRDNQRTRG